MHAQLRERAGELEAAGVRVACVIQARPERARELCPGPEILCVPDPERKSHRAIGLTRMSPLGLLFSGDLRKRRREAVAGGFAQDWKKTFARESDGLLLPGALITARGGEIRWIHRGKHVGDLPSAQELVAIVRRVL